MVVADGADIFLCHFLTMRIEQGRFGNLELQSIGFQVARMLKQQNDRLDDWMV